MSTGDSEPFLIWSGFLEGELVESGLCLENGSGETDSFSFEATKLFSPLFFQLGVRSSSFY